MTDVILNFKFCELSSSINLGLINCLKQASPGDNVGPNMKYHIPLMKNEELIILLYLQ